MDNQDTRRNFLKDLLATGSSLVLAGEQNADAQLRPVRQPAFPLPKLNKGVNLSNWLAGARRQPMFDRDFKQIKQAGFDHIRLPVNPENFGFSFNPARKPGELTKIDFTKMDEAIALGKKNGLPVILDIHPPGKFMSALENNDWAERQFVELWQQIAKRYAKVSPKDMVFEILNEPQYYKKEARYQALAEKTVKAIRATGDKRLIVVGGAHGSAIEGLLKLKPIAGDKNIIYSFHFYEPYIVTHQGVKSGFDNDLLVRKAHGVEYPPERATRDAADYFPGHPNVEESKVRLKKYIDEKWGPEKIAGRIALAAGWAKKNHVNITCGEFGVQRTDADAKTRYAWMGDVRKAVEKQHISWQVYDYGDLFGIAKPTGKISGPAADGSIRLAEPLKGKHVFDPEAFAAFGLKPLGKAAPSR